MRTTCRGASSKTDIWSVKEENVNVLFLDAEKCRVAPVFREMKLNHMLH